MARVTGIGGIFFKSRNPEALREWYRLHLGVDIKPWGGAVFPWNEGASTGADGVTVWNIFPADTGYFAPSEAAFMVNYRVADLRALLDALRAEGCNVDEKVEESELGRFGWVLDPDGNKVELWEPPVAPVKE
ncbi:MAG TPA: VOC family protein [Candidatus Krumholzibacteria bacterium]|nr:VOC family protein [Candidatus Krumholzibacteria bacterium]HPD73266.1 VOC family protein [Candidatus Krumholzibacteria bacterium]HRY40228.1 VOC family protein [Candidatus Krumholzibacteria bacterium]